MKNKGIVFGNEVYTVEITLPRDMVGSHRSSIDRTVHINPQKGVIYVSMDQLGAATIMSACHAESDVIAEDDRYYINVDWVIDYFLSEETRVGKRRAEYFKNIKELAKSYYKDVIGE